MQCLLVLMTLASAVALNANGAPISPSRPHKLRVYDPVAASALIAQGGRLIADYGSFQLVETANVPARLAKTESADDSDFIELRAAKLDTRATEVKALRRAAGTFAGKRLHLVQFAGPVKPEWFTALEATGVRVVHYIPQNAYLVQGNAAAMAKLQNWAAKSEFVQWDGNYADEYKLHPGARLTDAKGRPQKVASDTFAIQLLDDAEANPATVALIEQLKLEPVKQQFRALQYQNVVVRLPPGRLAEIAARPEVISIRPYVEPHKTDERQDQIVAGNLSGSAPVGPGYLAWLTSKGFDQTQFTASAFGVDVTDSGIDNGTTMPGHFGLYVAGDPSASSRVLYNRLEGSPNSGSTLQGCDGHGNLNSHIIAGFNDRPDGFPHTDAAGFHYGLGVCPFVKVGSSVIFDPDKYTYPDFSSLQSRAYNDGARISGNSWGADTYGDYDGQAQAYDALVRDAQPSGSAVPNAGNQEMVIVFAAGNAGSGAQTVGSPGTAKNIITVGAAENVHSHATANGGNTASGSDGCSVADSGADSANDIIYFSSRGPCDDGRRKPDIVAPGTHVTGGVGQSSTNADGTGSALACFVATGACALPGGGTAGNANNFFPLGQQFYTTSSGTSHSTPAIAGACALVRQYFINHGHNAPSPAMTKAFLMNSARYLTGVSANDTLPSNNQGMGEVNLGTAFDDIGRVLRDQVGVDKFTATGQARTFTGTITDPGQPFRVTLAWTDAPGNTAGSAYNNNLDLTVTLGGNTYKGNVFSGANSITDGIADSVNNVESVFLPAGVSGSFVVTVTAANINSDGVPNEAPSLDQDFALVMYNAVPATGPVISADSISIISESCAPTNGAVDPNENVTVAFALRNVGTADTASLVATLQSTGGITSVSGPLNYGVLAAGGSAVTQAFSFSANVVCGTTLAATLALTDGVTNLGAVTFTIPIGQLEAVLAENFDTLAAPALPAGWTTSQSGAQSLWVAATDQQDSLPNSAFATDAGSIGATDLISPPIAIASGSSQLTFRHYFNTESSWDGGVLEIKIGDGVFLDILTAGGSFISGQYNQTLQSSGSPIAGRQAWSGNSGGFVTTTVNLPASAAGQNVQFKWRCGSDDSVSGAGWYVDSITVNDRVCCGGNSVNAPIIVADGAALVAENCAPANGVIDPGETVTVNISLKNIGSGNTTNLVATLTPGGGVAAPGGPQNYGIVSTNGVAVARPFTFTSTGACGETVVATFQLQDGATVLFPLAFNFSLGQVATLLAQNFDGVTAPALPAGWTTSQTDAQSSWVTTTNAIDTAPNATYSPEPGAVGVNELVSGTVLLPSGSAQLSFRNRFDLEAGAGGTGYDAGVLEIAIGAGSFADIVDAGGSFVGGGYTHSISSSYGNPLAGRQGWSGNSGGFITTTANLPPTAAGQAVRLRWRCGTDSSVSGAGWYVDSVSITGRACCTNVGAPIVINQPVNTTVPVGSTTNFALTVLGETPLTYQWQKNGVNLTNGGHYSGVTSNMLTVAAADGSDEANYRCIVTNAYGSATSSPAMLTLVVIPPSAPVATAATGAAAFSFTANWNAASGATGYRLDLSTNSTFSSFVSGYENLDVGDVLSRNVTALTTELTYYYRVRAYNSAGDSTNSATIAVTPKPVQCAGIVNPSFEGGNSGGVANGWIAYQREPAPTNTVWSIETASPVFGSGFQYQQIANSSSAGGAGVRQDITGLVPGGTYTISGWMRGNSTSDTTCTVKVSPTASTNWATAVELNPPQSYTGGTWMPFSGTVVVTGTNMTLWLDGQTGGSGEFKAQCFDAVTVACTDIPAPLQFESVTWPGSNQVHLVLSGHIGDSVTILRSSNLTSWLPLVNLTNATGTLQYTDTIATNATQQFYRAVSP